MFRYFIYLAYNGAAYCGWQVQPNGVSVQEMVTAALRTILRIADLEITAAGRTDAGVHAKEMPAHFDLPFEIENQEILCKKLNRFLPCDISVLKIVAVKNTAHARFDALSRRYEYHIVTQKNVFIGGISTRIETLLDFEKMNTAATLLTDYKDFTSFSKLHTDTKTNDCTITHAQWTQQSIHHWIFTIEANRFLRNMVRAIVGTLIEVGRGKISMEDFRQIIENKNRCTAGESVPAQGLFLVKVKYDEKILKSKPKSDH